MELREEQKEREKRDGEGEDNKALLAKRVLDFRLAGLELLPRRAQTPGLHPRLRITSPSTRDEPLQTQLLLSDVVWMPQVS